MYNKIFGNHGEKLAAEMLQSKKYTVIAQNYKSGGYEIDIAAFKRGVLVIVEVKSRSSTAFGEAKDAVNTVKQLRIKAATRGFLLEQAHFGKIPVYNKLFRRQIPKKIKCVRYDVVEVYFFNRTEYKINHLENFFY
ncbi:MAG: YraN family protein [Clostridia bacterium]